MTGAYSSCAPITLSMVMLLGGTSTAFASGSNDKVVSEDLAMAIAYDFLLSREENEDIIEKLPNDYNLILSKTIYETEGVPSAYKFDIEDEKDTYHGYNAIAIIFSFIYFPPSYRINL